MTVGDVIRLILADTPEEESPTWVEIELTEDMVSAGSCWCDHDDCCA